MSTINTSGIDVNYPVPGQNNSTQGFRDNFSAIKNNLTTAGDEITELQQKVVLKEGLNGVTLNNDMANTLISNAAVRSFRHTTYNLGNSLSGTVLVNATLGDVHLGTITGDTTIQFAGWAPINTQSSLRLRLTVANTEANITFPGEVSFSQGLVENNGETNGNLVILKAPYEAGVLEYDFTTLDCGNSITITPVNRPYQSTQIAERKYVTPTGFEGDRPGTILSAPSIPPVTVTATTATTNVFSTDSTDGFYVDMPITFTGNVFGGITAGQPYYVTYFDEDVEFAVGRTVGGANVTLSNASGNMQATPVAYQYQCIATYDSNTWVSIITSSTESSDQITLANTLASPTTQYQNQPIIFSDDSNGSNVALMGLDANVVYYIKSIPSSTSVTLTRSRTNGVADGTTVDLLDATPTNVSATVYYQGHDIWQQVPLLPDTGIDQNLSLLNLQVNGNLTLDTPANLIMGGGLNGYFLQTDGAGGLSWVAGGGSGNGAVGGSNTQIQYNDGGSFAGSPNLTFDGTTLTVIGDADVIGNISANNLGNVSAVDLDGNVSNLLTGAGTFVAIPTVPTVGNIAVLDLDGNVSSVLRGDGTWGSVASSVYGNANVVLLLDSFGSNSINTTGNITAATITTTGNITTSATLESNIINANLIDVNGNISALNITATTGNLSGNVEALSGNIVSLATVFFTGENVVANTRLEVSNVVTVDSFIQVSASSGLEGIGSSGADALSLTKHINEITTVSMPNTSGVALPKALAGMRIIIRNSAASNVIVYTNPDDGIMGTPNTAITLGNLTPNTSVEYFTATGTANTIGTWYTL